MQLSLAYMTDWSARGAGAGRQTHQSAMPDGQDYEARLKIMLLADPLASPCEPEIVSGRLPDAR